MTPAYLSFHSCLDVVTKLGGEDRSQLDKEDLYLYPTWVGCAAAECRYCAVTKQ